MLSSQINPTMFSACKFSLKNIKPNEIKSIGAIKKYAQDRELDVYIAKKESAKHFPNMSLYTFLVSSPKSKICASNTLIDKKANLKEQSVKIFNDFMILAEQICGKFI